jgi:large subunit ribosomal protein L18
MYAERLEKPPSQWVSNKVIHMKSIKSKKLARDRRHGRVRAKVSGNATKPRLAVFRSLLYTYAQVIDDEKGATLAHASTREIKEKMDKSAKSAAAGKLLAERVKALGINKVVFDRGGFLYHGRVKALADGAREAGLEF